MIDEEVVVLGDEYLLGHGDHKVVYVDPRDDACCLKIIPNPDDVDWHREMLYRKILTRRGRVCASLPQYLGIVQTNLGTAHIFERIRDYDGKTSENLHDILEKERQSSVPNIAAIRSYFAKLGQTLLRDILVMTNMENRNFLIMRHSASVEDFSVRIIDNIGTHAKIPLVLMNDRLSRMHVKRYLKKYWINMQENYPQFTAVIGEDDLNWR